MKGNGKVSASSFHIPRSPRALVLTGYGLNCDLETTHAFELAGAEAHRVHINQLIIGESIGEIVRLEDYEIVAFIGGFSWGDDHGAGVLLATKLLYNIGEEMLAFIEAGKLVIGICNGFQALVNLGLLPGFDGDYRSRRVALIWNDCGNFRDQWVHLRVNEDSRCVFTRGLERLELAVRHGEGKFYAEEPIIKRILEENQVVLRYADKEGNPAKGRFPENPNGSLEDIAGICDSTGRVFGLMPHPEAFNHWTNHPEWTRQKEHYRRKRKPYPTEGGGIQIFRNAVNYFKH
ncbi:MAG: phosphoribosylformylglycinamidine synthase subunit PurQ [Deltaproteobacteria bacterium]|nr:MAG: phosphoribosylformylglycinamidine synthase subunit PurQ [Deltaproteobacteria bacterium]